MSFKKWFENFHCQIRKPGFSKGMAEHYAMSAWLFQQKKIDMLKKEIELLTKERDDYLGFMTDHLEFDNDFPEFQSIMSRREVEKLLNKWKNKE